MSNFLGFIQLSHGFCFKYYLGKKQGWHCQFNNIKASLETILPKDCILKAFPSSNLKVWHKAGTAIFYCTILRYRLQDDYNYVKVF